MTIVRRAVTVAVLSALAGVLLFEAASISRRDVRLEMDREIPKPAGDGFQGPETGQGESYQWTGGFALVRLAGLDRHVAWSCGIRIGAPRPPNSAPVSAGLEVDGATPVTALASEAFQELRFALPQASSRGAKIGIKSDPNWAPGGSDRRTLGVQVDWIRCAPESRFVWPPFAKAEQAALIAGLLGLTFALAGLWLTDAIAIVAVIALGLAVAFTSGAAPFLRYSSTITIAALWIAAAFLLFVKGAEGWRRAALARPALVATAISAAALLLKLAAVLHPSMPLGDSLFQAHRLRDVLDGTSYFFTRQVGDAEMPYAIALFVFAGPWSALTSGTPSDLVALLRVVVVASDAIAGGLLYLIAVRAWGKPWTGVVAVVLFHSVPLPYMVLANGNLTNAFAQSAALVALAAATLWTMSRHRVLKVVGLTALFALAFCSHISTVVLLTATLLAMSGVGVVRGGEPRAVAISLVAATVLAFALSTVAYYGHFTDVYAQAIQRLRAPATAVVAGPSNAPTAGVSETRARANIELMSRAARASTALSHAQSQIGWPLLVLMALGLGALRLPGPGARLGQLLMAWMVVWFGFLISGVMGNVGPQYGPYAIEFLDRVNLAVYPGAILLAASGLAAVWRPVSDRRPLSLAGRAGALLLLAGALRIGTDAWMSWIR